MEAPSTALLTDRYELTMLDAALAAGVAGRMSAFEVFARDLHGRRYGVVAGTGRLLELVSRFRFDTGELEWLARENVVSSATIDWLADYRFRGSISGYREGELYFPGSPVLSIEAPFAEAVLLETLVLSVLNHDSAVATAAARMVSAAGHRPIAEMGSRRTGERSAVAAARAAYIAGFSATSNLDAGRRWGVPTMGTAAHAFTLLFDSEEAAFHAQVAAMGPDTTLLVDTYDIPTAVETAVRVAGSALGAVRIDSGDLAILSRQVRAQLDALGATSTRITVTNDLDEFAIAALADAPVDSFGVGTSVVTGSGVPAAGMIYKLVAHQDESGTWIPVAKQSVQKATVAGRKRAIRFLDDGVAIREGVLLPEAHVPSGEVRHLRVDLAIEGTPISDYVGSRGVGNARDHHARVLAELRQDAFDLSPGEPAIETGYFSFS